MFENLSALILLMLLLPVIVLYMLRPKPRTIKIPSLMLLIPASQKRQLKSLLETLIKDPLLLIQLIAIIILVLGIANPYYLGSATYDRTVIVLDNSASMSATDVAPDRFSQAISVANEYIASSEKISVILAGNSPVLLFKDEDSEKAMAGIRQLKPKATETNLNDAMLLAIDLIGDEKGKLAVISDFSAQDITEAHKIMEAKNIPVEYRQVGTGGSNVGIVEAATEGGDLKFFVKNYNDAAKNVRIKIVHGDTVKSIDQTIKPKSKDFFIASNINGGRTAVSLEPDDDLSLDNTLYVSMPESASNRVLLISDSSGKKSPVSVAFNSIPYLVVDEVSFDRAPRKLDYSLVVLYDFTKTSPLPGTFDDLRNYVEGGGTLVIAASSDLPFMDTKGLLPVEVSEIADASRFEAKKTDLTDGIDFAVSRYLEGTLKDGAVELASAREGPVLAYWNVGRGMVVYLGMNDQWGDFHLQASYPVFWFKLLKFANPAPEELNFKTGTLLPLGSLKQVQGPRFAIETDNLYLDESGFYKVGERTIAANLLDQKESDISIKKIDLNFIENEKLSRSKIEKKYLSVILSIFAILLIALELYYLRHRGDI